MIKLISALAALAFAGTLIAQNDPWVGTWKLDASKTAYTKGAPAKDVTLTIEEQGDNYQVTATGTNSDGSPISVKYTIPKKGGAGQVQEGPYDAISTKRISGTVRENTYMKGGQEVAMRRSVVSKDGKTLRTTVKGKNAQGEEVAGTDVYEKQ